MAPLYRHLAHPVDGILNTTGEGTTSQLTGTASSKGLVTSNLLSGRKVSQKINLPWDEKLYDSLVEENKKELDALQKEEDDAAEAAGDTEVQAARGKRAEFWARVGDRVRYFYFLFIFLFCYLYGLIDWFLLALSLCTFFSFLTVTCTPLGQGSCRLRSSV